MQVGNFVTIKTSGEKGRLLAIYPAHDGTTLKVKTPNGDRWVDMPSGASMEDFLSLLPKKVSA